MHPLIYCRWWLTPSVRFLTLSSWLTVRMSAFGAFSFLVSCHCVKVLSESLCPSYPSCFFGAFGAFSFWSWFDQPQKAPECTKKHQTGAFLFLKSQCLRCVCRPSPCSPYHAFVGFLVLLVLFRSSHGSTSPKKRLNVPKSANLLIFRSFWLSSLRL